MFLPSAVAGYDEGVYVAYVWVEVNSDLNPPARVLVVALQA